MAFTDVLSILINIFLHKELKTKRKSAFYHTPDRIGYKMQLDVKHVPKHCKHKNLPLDKNITNTLLTIIDEASRERFIYFFDEYNQFNTTQFLMIAIKYYGYIPNISQTDNGPEFTGVVIIKWTRKIRENEKGYNYDKKALFKRI